MFNLIKKYLKLIDSIFTNILQDLTHFRVWLVIIAICFNLITMWLVAFHNVDYKAFLCSFGAVTIVFTYYFHSKSSESKQDHELTLRKLYIKKDDSEDEDGEPDLE